MCHHLLDGFLHLRRFGRDRHRGAAVGGNALVDGQNICAGTGKNRKDIGQYAGVVLEHRVERDDAAGLHVIEGAHRIAVLIKCAAADTDGAGGVARSAHLSGLEHALCLRHLDKNFRQSICRDQIKLCCRRHNCFSYTVICLYMAGF